MQMQAPGKNRDLDDAQLKAWTRFVASTFDASIREASREGTAPWFVNATALPAAPDAHKDVDWTAFPKRRPGQHVAVDTNRQWQDEYCEWAVEGADDRITAVTFTTETPDYFEFLSTEAPEALLALYHRYVSPAVRPDDLLDGDGKYDRTNPWNGGAKAPARILHMAQGNNYFSAAATLAAIAAWPAVEPDGDDVVAEQPLINCLRFGVASRHSDPHIGAQVNEVVRAGHKVTLADPVGLYIHRIMLSDVETPDGSPITDWLEYDDDRGIDGFRTRATFRAPHGTNHTVSDLTVDGEPVRSGGQLAEKLRVRLRGWAIATTDEALPPVRCGQA